MWLVLGEPMVGCSGTCGWAWFGVDFVGTVGAHLVKWNNAALHEPQKGRTIMENKVGDNVPSSAEFEKQLKQLEDVLSWLRTFCVNLSDEERAGLTRGRRGAEPHVYRLAELAKKYGWSAPGVTADDVLADLNLMSAIQPLRESARQILDLLDDTQREAASEANEGGYLFYGIAKSIASRVPEVDSAVHPFAEFLSKTRKPRTPRTP